MKLTRLVLFITMFVVCCTLSAQLSQVSGGFRVEPVEFSPPVQEIIAGFINKPAPAFQANDLLGISRTISNYYGKSLVLLFWSKDDPTSLDLLPYLTELAKEMPDLKADLLTFADQSRSVITQFAKERDIQFSIIPNGSFLGEAIYGKELGTPRFFLTDRKGVIKHIIPQEQLQDPASAIATIKAYLAALLADH